MTLSELATSATRVAGDRAFDVVVVAASLGGITAVQAVLAGLPATFPTPVLVVQHSRRRPLYDQLPEVFGRRCALPVRHVVDGQPLTDPGVSVVPTGHAVVARHERLHLIDAGGRRPADTLMTSLAPLMGRRALAVVLTGRLDDGTVGAQAIKRHGGRVLVQDPATAEARDMPVNVMATGCVDFALDPGRIPAALVTLTMAPGGAELFRVPTPPWATLEA